MTQIKTRKTAPADTEVLIDQGLHPVMARLYVARGVRSTEEIETGLARLLPPTMLKGIEEAALLLADALEAESRLLVIADYDCDGATACAVAVRGLRMFGAQVDYLVPNRFEYGYGLTPEIVALAQTREPDLLITVDNGIASVEGVAAANALGIAVLVTDHHLPGDTLPAADAIAAIWFTSPCCTAALGGHELAFALLVYARYARTPRRPRKRSGIRVTQSAARSTATQKRPAPPPSSLGTADSGPTLGILPRWA